MDNNKKLSEKLLKADGINPATPTEPERIAFRELLDQHSKPKKPGPQPTLWRLIMKSKITKLAAAAVIILAVIVGLNQFGGNIDGASVSWAQVVEKLNNYEKYKCRQRVVRQNGPEFPTMDVYHLNLSLRRQEAENGDIHIIDMRGTDAITVELNPAQKKATVTKLLGFGPRKDPHIVEMVKRFAQESTEKLGTKTQNGKTLHGFRHQPSEHSEFTVWVDAETKLPVEIEIKHLNRGQTLFLDEFEFDFDLDPSAFSTEIPQGYEVKTIINDYRPVEPKVITAADIQSELDHNAYTVANLPWIEKTVIMKILDPLGTRSLDYITAIQTNDQNTIIIVQGVYYDPARMVWIPKQQLTMETPSGAKLYTHPNGSIYAKCYFESLAKANPEFFDINNLSDQRFTRMIVMPDNTIMGLSSNRQMTDEKLQELVESLTEIKAD